MHAKGPGVKVWILSWVGSLFCIASHSRKECRGKAPLNQTNVYQGTVLWLPYKYCQVCFVLKTPLGDESQTAGPITRVVRGRELCQFISNSHKRPGSGYRPNPRVVGNDSGNLGVFEQCRVINNSFTKGVHKRSKWVPFIKP